MPGAKNHIIVIGNVTKSLALFSQHSIYLSNLGCKHMAHILLAEDDTSLRHFLALALEKAGHIVTSAHDGLDGLHALKKENTFDLLLTDIVMPGMDGVELARRAKKEHPGIEVMFITGFAAVAMRGLNATNENTRVLSKPFHLNDLVKQVDTLLAA